MEGNDLPRIRPLPRNPQEQHQNKPQQLTTNNSNSNPSSSSLFQDPLQSQFYPDQYSQFDSDHALTSTTSLSRMDSLDPSFESSSEEEEEDSHSTRYVVNSPRNRISSRSPLQPTFNLPSDENLDSNRANQTPERSPSRSYPKGDPLGRRTTLSAAARSIRRVSLRVVNLAGAAGADILARDTEGRSPSSRKHPHSRLDDQEDGVVSEGDGEPEEEEVDTWNEFVIDELRGTTLRMFGPTNWFRVKCARILRLRWTEPIILLCILLSVIFLTIQATPDVYLFPRPTSGYFHSWLDYGIFSLFCLFTVEIFARIIVSGLFINPVEDKSIGRMRQQERSDDSTRYPPKPHRDTSLDHKSTPTTSSIPSRRAQNISITSTLTSSSTPFVLAVRKQRTTYQHAFLRHSWNRLDVLAVTSFWVCFILATLGLEAGNNLYMFRALSVLRATRLLAVTAGTSTILQSLKKAAPQLANVALFVIFAMSLFSIIGVQSFQQSFRRNCVWIDPSNVFPNVSFPNQHCGGYIDTASGIAVGYLVNATGLPSTEGPKGFICPNLSICMETQNPNNGATSFDNIFAALLQIVIVASANTWTVTMFDMIDSDYFASCIFFIVALIVLNYWLINLFIAVITQTFASIMDETKRSAFSSASLGTTLEALEVPANKINRGFRRGSTFIRKLYERTHLIWVAVVLADIAFQASKTSNMSDSHANLLDRAEFYFTISLDVEVVIRIFSALPDWRDLFSEGGNIADISLAVLTSIIQIPVIKNSSAYPWLTTFQIARFYRVILAIPRIKRLLVRITGTFHGLVNMILFLMFSNFIAALIATQLLRGIPNTEEDETKYMTFFQIFNSFLAMYQILTSENWTDVLNNVLTSQTDQFQLAVSAAFLSIWMLFSYFILMSMFIAVLNENFTIAEELKHKHQMEAFVLKTEPQAITVGYLTRFNPYNFLKPRPKVTPLESFTEEKVELELQRTSTRLEPRTAGDEAFVDPDDRARELLSERRALQSNFIIAHPTYDKSLWIFSQKNPIRRFCQRLVDPAFGERLDGQLAVKRDKFIFQAIMLAAIVGSVVIAGVATPVYRRNYFLNHGSIRLTWFNLTEVSLGFIFVLEFLIKIIADGFVFAPNAYLLSIWNDLDFFILITLVVNITSALISGGKISRFTRSLKAFRALRFINLSSRLRETFYSVLIVGAVRIIDASILAVLYIIPFAILGQNIFSGTLYSCNDSSIATKAECAGEYLNSVVGTFEFVSVRTWANPYVWSFDSFQSAILILFEIISLEGWVAVMESSMGLIGIDQQPVQNASQFNALFFVFYQLIGGAVILTLFISVILENFHRRSGMSLLTSQQRDWSQLKKLILRQRPEKRPEKRPQSAFRSWCYDRAVEKNGYWSKTLTGLYVFHIIILCTQATSNPSWADAARNFVFLGLTIIYLIDIFVRVSGLGWKSYIQNGWNLYDVVVVTGTFATTIPLIFGTQSIAALQLQKLFVVSIAFKLVQKNTELNQLFKTARASLPAILSIFSLWLVFFFTWTILYLEVFGLTRWGVYGTRTANYSAFSNVMIMLVLASTGEGWNGFMHDYTVAFPNCTESTNFLLSDCGSPVWAYVLFITWNVLSMYLMANLILGAVVENFSYVFQTNGNLSLDREQMRKFKSAWASFDINRTGYINRESIVPFLARMTGVFEVVIYKEEWSIKSIETLATPLSGGELGRFVFAKRCHGNSLVDVARVSRCLKMIDFAEVKVRKQVWNRLYHEAMLDAEGEKGISFTQMLLLLSHYKLINDDRALKIEEKIQRKERTDLVIERVNKDRLNSTLLTIILRRRYLLLKKASIPVLPEIVINSEDFLESPPRDHSDSPSPSRSKSRSPFSLEPGTAE